MVMMMAQNRLEFDENFPIRILKHESGAALKLDLFSSYIHSFRKFQQQRKKDTSI